MSLSSFAKEVIERVLGSSSVTSGKNNSITYDIKLSSTRDDSTVMTSSFKFKKPLRQSVVEEKLPAYIDLLSDYLAAENLGVVNSILQKYGLSTKKLGESRVTGTIASNTDEAEELTGDNLLSVRAKSGRFISLGNLKSLIEIATKAYMMKHMTEGGPQLHNQTGRFINNTNIKNIIVMRTGRTGKYTLRVIYGYMLYPYETFDPAGPNSRGLASIDRNPRRIIGDAVAKAIDDLINMEFYNLEVLQS